MYAAQGPLKIDYTGMARECACPPQTFRKSFNELLACGKLIETNGQVFNEKVAINLEVSLKKSSISSNAANTRWAKFNQQKQRIDDAYALPTHDFGICQTDATTTTTTEVRKEDMSVSNETRPKPKKVYDEGFETFWTAYPKDAGMAKAEAGKVWMKLDALDRQKAIDAIPAFKVWVSKQGKDYRTVHACRYLSQRRFDGFEAVSQTAQVNQVFVIEGSEAFTAWEKFNKKKSPAMELRGHGTKRGWLFPTEYPPRANLSHSQTENQGAQTDNTN